MQPRRVETFQSSRLDVAGSFRPPACSSSSALDTKPGSPQATESPAVSARSLRQKVASMEHRRTGRRRGSDFVQLFRRPFREIVLREVAAGLSPAAVGTLVVLVIEA